LAIAGYFVAAFLFLSWFVVLAVRNKTDLVRPDYYEEEMRFQQQLDRLKRTDQLTTGASIGYDVTNQAITITLPPGHAHPSGRIYCYRPSDASLDREIVLNVNSEGVQHVDTARWREGLWKVRLQWKVADEEFSFAQPIFLAAHSY
jgi:hypothetical protein